MSLKSSWFRDFYPIIYNGNDIIAVPNILVADNTDNLSKDQFSWRTPELFKKIYFIVMTQLLLSINLIIF